MVHLKLRNTDIKLKLIKYLIFMSILLVSACDFRLPQKWETPSWQLPISIPLYNGNITTVSYTHLTLPTNREV